MTPPFPALVEVGTLEHKGACLHAVACAPPATLPPLPQVLLLPPLATVCLLAWLLGIKSR